MTSPSLPGPAFPDLVAALPTVNADAADPQLKEVVDGINANLRRFLSPVTGSDGARYWSEDHVLGATLLAGQLWRRRGAAGSVEFSPSGDPVYLQRNHPDIARLLGLGAFTPPRVG